MYTGQEEGCYVFKDYRGNCMIVSNKNRKDFINFFSGSKQYTEFVTILEIPPQPGSCTYVNVHPSIRQILIGVFQQLLEKKTQFEELIATAAKVSDVLFVHSRTNLHEMRIRYQSSSMLPLEYVYASQLKDYRLFLNTQICVRISQDHYLEMCKIFLQMFALYIGLVNELQLPSCFLFSTSNAFFLSTPATPCCPKRPTMTLYVDDPTPALYPCDLFPNHEVKKETFSNFCKRMMQSFLETIPHDVLPAYISLKLCQTKFGKDIFSCPYKLLGVLNSNKTTIYAPKMSSSPGQVVHIYVLPSVPCSPSNLAQESYKSLLKFFETNVLSIYTPTVLDLMVRKLAQAAVGVSSFGASMKNVGSFFSNIDELIQRHKVAANTVGQTGLLCAEDVFGAASIISKYNQLQKCKSDGDCHLGMHVLRTLPAHTSYLEDGKVTVCAYEIPDHEVEKRLRSVVQEKPADICHFPVVHKHGIQGVQGIVVALLTMGDFAGFRIILSKRDSLSIDFQTLYTNLNKCVEKINSTSSFFGENRQLVLFCTSPRKCTRPFLRALKEKVQNMRLKNTTIVPVLVTCLGRALPNKRNRGQCKLMSESHQIKERQSTILHLYTELLHQNCKQVELVILQGDMQRSLLHNSPILRAVETVDGFDKRTERTKYPKLLLEICEDNFHFQTKTRVKSSSLVQTILNTFVQVPGAAGSLPAKLLTLKRNLEVSCAMQYTSCFANVPNVSCTSEAVDKMTMDSPYASFPTLYIHHMSFAEGKSFFAESNFELKNVEFYKELNSYFRFFSALSFFFYIARNKSMSNFLEQENEFLPEVIYILLDTMSSLFEDTTVEKEGAFSWKQRFSSALYKRSLFVQEGKLTKHEQADAHDAVLACLPHLQDGSVLARIVRHLLCQSKELTRTYVEELCSNKIFSADVYSKANHAYNLLYTHKNDRDLIPGYNEYKTTRSRIRTIVIEAVSNVLFQKSTSNTLDVNDCRMLHILTDGKMFEKLITLLVQFEKRLVIGISPLAFGKFQKIFDTFAKCYQNNPVPFSPLTKIVSIPTSLHVVTNIPTTTCQLQAACTGTLYSIGQKTNPKTLTKIHVAMGNKDILDIFLKVKFLPNQGNPICNFKYIHYCEF